MRQKLHSLYLLQLLDTELDELRELRGDLPDAVNKLEAQVKELDTKIQEYDEFLKQGAVSRTRKEKESIELIEKIEKYKLQQLDVKNNKEYDALTHQIEAAETIINQYEEEMELFTDEAVEIKEKMTELQTECDALRTALVAKNDELGDIMSASKEEEDAIVKKREAVLSEVTKADLAMYTKIRTAKGAAVVTIKRGSCSGCYNIVPPQLVLEVKKNERLYTCEHCGRILVSEEIAMETTI